MDNLVQFLPFYPVNTVTPYILFQIQGIFICEVGSVRTNSVSADVPEIEGFLVDPSQEVTDKREPKFRS
jgi:hypothetical protein